MPGPIPSEVPASREMLILTAESTPRGRARVSGTENKFAIQRYCWIQWSNAIWEGFAFS